MRKSNLYSPRRCLPATIFYYLRFHLLLALVGLATMKVPAAGTWRPLATQAPDNIEVMLLLSDGTIMCQPYGGSGWYRLTPDIHGSYVNGTWTALAPMHDSRLYYSTQVLRDGRVYVAGGEYGTGTDKAEVYDPLSNSWMQAATPPGSIIDNVSETLPNGNVLEGSPGTDIRIYDIVANTWSATITPLGGQDEASWIKLQDGSIMTLTGTNTERFIPALNRWVADANLPVPIFGWGYEMGAGFLLPNGKAIYFGGSGHTAIYTPWTTNYMGVYTPAGVTNVGVWVQGPDIPNQNAAIDAPQAMMVNGKILCTMTDTNNGFGVNTYFYEYDYIANSFTAITAPGGGSFAGGVSYVKNLLDLPDGTVLYCADSRQLYTYTPVGTPLANGMPTILSATTNLDGSFHLTGTVLNGISEGACYGDETQQSTDYPVARMTNTAGNILYCRTYNWSTCNLMTGTNVVSTEMTLPAGLLAGTYPLFVTANGISSAPYPLTINGTPLPAIAGLAFTAVASNQMTFHWSSIGLTETGYVVQLSTNGVDYSTLAVLATNILTYTDNTVTPLGQYYYRVLGTNSVGLGIAAPAIFAASPPVVAAASPWQAKDIGLVLGRGASGLDSGTFTIIGSGSAIGGSEDQFQFLFQPVAGDVTITARIVASQNTGANALAGMMVRNSREKSSAEVLMAFNAGSSNTVFQSRVSEGSIASQANDVGGLSAPYWIRLVRTGNNFTGYSSPDGTTWTQVGSSLAIMEPLVYVGLAVGSGTYNLLNSSVFDNVTVTGAASSNAIPLAQWKLDETMGTIAADSRGINDGTYNSVVLGQPGATTGSGYAANFNGTNANITIPGLNLNSNILTITGWVNRNGNQNSFAGIFYNRANSTVAGLHFGSANELRYTWNNSASTYNFNSGLVVPNNQWTFVALVIEPTRARLFMGANGVLVSATNNISNPVQAFDGTSYIGQDSSSSARYINGQLDEIQFFNQALTQAQLAQLASPPIVALTSPVNGSSVQAFATLNLSVSLSNTNGHSLSYVSYFTDNGQLLGSSFTPPFDATTTNLNNGVYAVFARLFYDAGYSVDSTLNGVVVSVLPSITNTWDANTLTSGAQDGNGVWGGNSTNWWNGSANVAWTDYSPAVFGSGTTTNCVVTLTNDVIPYSITFNLNAGGTYTLSGTNSILLDVPGVPQSITANTTAIIRAPLQGNNSLVKLGTGTLTLAASNNYAGATIVGAGTLKLATNTAFGSGVVVTNSGTLDLNGQDFTASMLGLPFTLGGVGAGVTTLLNSSTTRALVHDVILNSNATISSANTIFIGGTNAVDGVLKLNGFTLTKAGSGTVVLNGLNVTGAGNITVSAGTLQLMDTYGNNQQDTSLAGSGTLTINSGATVVTPRWSPTLIVSMPMVLNGGAFSSVFPGPNNMTFASAIVVSNNSTINMNGGNTPAGYGNCAFSGNITGPGGLTLTGDGDIRTFTGNNSYGWTTISAGILKIGNAGATGLLGLGTVTNNGGLIFNRTGTLLVTNRISGTGTLMQSGPGTLNLYGTNLYTGGTTNAGGILIVSAPETAGTSGPLGRSGTIVFQGGTLQYSSVNAFDYSSRFSTLTNQPFRIDTAGQNVNFATALTSTGGGSLTKLGAGVLALAGVNNFDGPTAIGAGTLAVIGNLKSPSAIMVTNGAALLVKANAANGIITNAASLTFGTTGATSFTVSNFVGNANAPVRVTNLIANGTVTVNVIGNPLLGQYPLIKYSGSIGGAGYAAFVLGAVPAGVYVTLNNNTANSSVDLVVATNTLIWSGAINSTWDTAVTANWTRAGGSSTFNTNGVAQFDDSASGSTAVILNTVVNASGLNFANNSKSYSISGSGSIVGSAALVKNGTGTVTLSNSNNYAGATTVNAGALLVHGSIPAGAVTVASNALLGGAGKVLGSTTIQLGGTLQPGLGGIIPATLTISNSLNLSGNVLFTLNKTNLPSSSSIVGIGSLTCGGNLIVTNTGPYTLTVGDSFDLFDATNFSGSFSTITLPALATNLVWDTSQLATNGVIYVASLPTITNQPQSLTVNSGAPASFTVGATGNATLGYQWFMNGTNLLGATTSSYNIASVTSTNAADYTVVVANSYGSVTSAVATLTVNVAPILIAPPQSATVYVNSNAVFSMSASGVPAPNYQWYFNLTNSLNVTTSNYLVTAAQVTNEGSYTVIVSNSVGSVTSSVATLSLFREYGHAPLPYPSLLSSNGARHLIVPGFQLGLTNLASMDARTNAASDDGVTFVSILRAGQAASVQVVASAAGYLSGWIDYNTNGSWLDTDEQVFTNVAVTAGTNILICTVPATAVTSVATWARFRFSSFTGLTVTGEAPDGEVEDYSIIILPSLPPVIDTPSIAFAGGSFTFGGTGGAGQAYTVLTASNLVTPVWLPIATIIADTNGAFYFTDPGATNQAGQFYRLRSP